LRPADRRATNTAAGGRCCDGHVGVGLAWEQMISMGMEEGIQEAMGQIDAMLAAG
jgi:hypothetical protein